MAEILHDNEESVSCSMLLANDFKICIAKRDNVEERLESIGGCWTDIE